MSNGTQYRARARLPVALASLSLLMGIGLTAWAGLNIAAGPVPRANPSGAPLFAQANVEPSSGDTSTAVAAIPVAPSPVGVLYDRYPEQGEMIGTLSIPALGKSLPVFEGTAEDELVKGVGHFAQSVLPGENDNCVLSGHRDTVFRQLGELKIGDLLVVQTSAGVFTYAISNTRIVEADDRTVIVPTDHAVLTVSTCYPFYYVGDAPQRYIVVADLVSSTLEP